MHAGRVRCSQVGHHNVIDILPEAMFTDSLVVVRCFQEGAFTSLGIWSKTELATGAGHAIDITNSMKWRLMIKLCHLEGELEKNRALLFSAEAEGTRRIPH